MIPACFHVHHQGDLVQVEIDPTVNDIDHLAHQWMPELAPRRLEISLRRISAVRSHLVAWMFAVRKALPHAEMHLVEVSPGAARALHRVGLERFVTIRKRTHETP